MLFNFSRKYIAQKCMSIQVHHLFVFSKSHMLYKLKIHKDIFLMKILEVIYFNKTTQNEHDL